MTRTSASNVPPSANRSGWMAIGLVSLATLLCYANSLGGAFVWDEQWSILSNPAARRLWHLRRMQSIRGLVDWSFAFNFAIAGADPLGYHIVNVGIHLLASLALFGLVRRTLISHKLIGRFGPHARGLALAIGLLWAVHPLNTEAVSYVVQRYELAAGLFYFFALYAFCRAVEPAANWNWFVVVILSYMAGLRCKETVVTLPLVLLWYDRAFVADCWRDLIRRKALYIAMAFATVILAGSTLAPTLSSLARQMLARTSSESHSGSVAQTSTVVMVAGMTPWSYLISQPAVIVHYLRLSFWPVGQCLDYDWPLAKSSAEIMPPSAVVLGLIMGIVWEARHCPSAAFLGGTFFLYLCRRRASCRSTI